MHHCFLKIYFQIQSSTLSFHKKEKRFIVKNLVLRQEIGPEEKSKFKGILSNKNSIRKAYYKNTFPLSLYNIDIDWAQDTFNKSSYKLAVSHFFSDPCGSAQDEDCSVSQRNTYT